MADAVTSNNMKLKPLCPCLVIRVILRNGLEILRARYLRQNWAFFGGLGKTTRSHFHHFSRSESGSIVWPATPPEGTPSTPPPLAAASLDRSCGPARLPASHRSGGPGTPRFCPRTITSLSLFGRGWAERVPAGAPRLGSGPWHGSTQRRSSWLQ